MATPYAAGQCTYWAYERRRQMGIGTPSYLGNGGFWWRSAPAYGLRVDHNAAGRRRTLPSCPAGMAPTAPMAMLP